MAKVSGERKKELIRVKLSAILQKSASNPKFAGVTIVDIKLSPDSASAVIFYSVYDTPEDIESITTALNNAAGFFQNKLAKTLQSRNTPRLRFVYDSGFDRTDKIEKLLSSISIRPESDFDEEE